MRVDGWYSYWGGYPSKYMHTAKHTRCPTTRYHKHFFSEVVCYYQAHKIRIMKKSERI